MANDVAIFLDLDNLVIGARDANLNFDVNLIVNHLKHHTGGRVVLRRAYSGNLRQDQKLMKEIATAGFTMQSAVALNNFGKNLIDMYMVVDTMDTLVDGQEYSTYVLVTGDRDFVPLIHALRRRGKHVIGVGLKHTTSDNLMGLCDEYIYYEDMLPAPPLSDSETEILLGKAVDSLLIGDERVRASVVKERMIEMSGGQFGRFQYTDTSFTKFLSHHSSRIILEKEGTTTYVRRSTDQVDAPELYRRYRSALKKQKLRVVPARQRMVILKNIIAALQEEDGLEWRELVDRLAARIPAGPDGDLSRNMINAVLVLARRAGIVRTLKGKTLSAAPVLLALEGDRLFQDGVIRTDTVYLEAIRALPEPFDLRTSGDRPVRATRVRVLSPADHGPAGCGPNRQPGPHPGSGLIGPPGTLPSEPSTRMIDEQAVWDDIWPVVEQLITATLAEDPQTIRQFLQPGEQAADALDLFGHTVFDILLKTVLGRERLGLTRAIEADGGRAVYIEYAWPDPESADRSYTAVDVVAVRLNHTGGQWQVAEINPASADLPLNTLRATGVLAGTQVLADDGKLPSEPWLLPIALYAGLLQIPLQPGAAGDSVEALFLPGFQARQYGFLPQIFGRRLWRDYRVSAGFTQADQPPAWAAAVEYILGEQNNRDQTQAAVGRHYKASLGAVSARVKHIKHALGISGLDGRYTDLQTTEIVYKES
jgi:hypothetical protein